MAPILIAQASVFLSAALLFVAQPMVGKMVLPTLGGTAQVWNTCLVFFQTVLLLGYLWAHISLKILGLRKQAIVHLFMVITTTLVLPIALSSTAIPPAEGPPLTWLLFLLATQVGPPLFALSATALLVQRWLASTHYPGNEDPYFLYAASNLGSMAALLLYPLALEPSINVEAQSRLWTRLFGGFILILTLNIGVSWKHMKPIQAQVPEKKASRSLRTSLKCLALSAVPSSFLLGITTHITEELPALPLLWITPLLAYLGSYVLAFSRQSILPIESIQKSYPLVLTLLALVLFLPLRASGYFLHLGAFFLTAFLLHAELARLRPQSDQLTEYYLIMAAGGALGGIFAGLIAPIIFPFAIELPLAILAAAALRPKAQSTRAGKARTPTPITTENKGMLDQFREKEMAGKTQRRGSIKISTQIGQSAILALLTMLLLYNLPLAGDARDFFARLGVLGVASMVVIYWRPHRLKFSLGIAVILMSGFLSFRAENTILMTRDYYGAYRVIKPAGTNRHELIHGTTLQGAQERSDGQGLRPSAYYHPESPIGHLLRTSKAQEPERRFGVIGLGVGSLAWYLNEQQSMHFFEISPRVHEIATNPEYFSFLRDAKGSVQIKLGDGRILLEQEDNQSFDLIFADAFSSDAVPAHLITREAIQIYMQKIRPGGLLTFTVSNRHLHLPELLASTAKDIGLAIRLCAPEFNSAQEKKGDLHGVWIALAHSEDDFKLWLSKDTRWTRANKLKNVTPWTDTHSSLSSIIKW